MLEMTKRLVNSVLSLNVSMDSQSLFVSVNQVMGFGIYAPGNILSSDRQLKGCSCPPHTVNFINLSSQRWEGCVCMEHQEMKLEMCCSCPQLRTTFGDSVQCIISKYIYPETSHLLMHIDYKVSLIFSATLLFKQNVLILISGDC